MAKVTRVRVSKYEPGPGDVWLFGDGRIALVDFCDPLRVGVRLSDGSSCGFEYRNSFARWLEANRAVDPRAEIVRLQVERDKAEAGILDIAEKGEAREKAIANSWEAYATKALDLIGQYGGIDGGHHKQWVLDQVVRALKGDKYDDWVKEHNDGEDGPNTYEWDVGIAP